MRGNGAQSDIDFHTLAKFQGSQDRIKAHVFDRGNMPLALLVYEDFWQDTSAVQSLANFIDGLTSVGTATDGSGAPKRPGRPIADPGPSKIMVKAATDATLSGADSLFTSTYSWSVVTQAASGDAVITNGTSATPTFHATVTGDYTVRLTVTGSGGQTDSKNITVTVNSAFPDPATISFATIRDILRNVTHTDGSSNSRTCVSCHVSGNTPKPPFFYAAIDRNNSGAADATDEDWLYKELVGRVNRTEVAASPLLRKPAGNHHNGLDILNLATTAGLSNFSKLYFWILNGAPTGGVAANAGADSSNTLTFSGSPASASVVLNGSASLGSITTYQWSIVSGPAGSSLLSATSVAASLVVQNVGTYVVQLAVSDGTNTSTATRTITVSETPVVADFSPANSATVPITFVAGSGSQALTPNITGTPVSCVWSVVSGSGSLSATSCSGATLNVGVAAVGTSVGVRLVVTGADGTNTSSTTHTLQIATASALSAAVIANSTSQTVSFTNTSGTSTAGFPTGSFLLQSTGSSSGGGTTYSWSITSQPDSSVNYAASLSSASAASPTLTVHRAGNYTLQLIVDNGTGPATATKTIAVGVPASATFANVKSVLTSPSACGMCHLWGSSPVPAMSPGAGQPWWDDLPDTNGDSLYTRVVARTNATNPTVSRLLDCPSHGCNSMTSATANGIPGFDSGASVATYNIFLNWIVGGTPP